ncbi:nickel-type superoxide dismutase maturation protease [Parasynechococcus sp.]|uniref:nickel-type superoxide dismutase maturation protease n=1 Tax=Parasynechococcus sp. TaxID=3101203 RepID=UPI0037037843
MDLLLFFCGRRLLIEVKGESMRPTLQAGDRVLVRPLTSASPDVEPGVVVVSWHPTNKEIRLIKRLRRRDASGLWLEGDNPDQSTDSRQLGLIPKTCLIGVVVGKIALNPPDETLSEHSR